MKNNWILRLFFVCLFWTLISCASDDAPPVAEVDNRVLLVHVNYADGEILGAYEYSFDREYSTFTTSEFFTEPVGTNHGRLAIYYDEVQQLIFEGQVRFMETGGHIIQPSPWILPQNLSMTTAANVVMPVNGFEERWNIMNYEIDYAQKFQNVQRMELVREYLQTNSGQKVKAILWTPIIGIGYEGDWSIIYMLKN